MDTQENLLSPEEMAALTADTPGAEADHASATSAPPAQPVPKPNAPERRASKRYPVRWRAALQLASDNTAYQGRTVNVSTQGCTLLSDYNAPQQGRITLFLQLPPQRAGSAPETVTLEARILHTSYSGQHQGFLVGIEYLPASASSLHRLAEHFGADLPRRRVAAG